MILTASDVSSISTILARWEWAEYIAEGFVVLGCLGELVADIGEKWLERRSKHLERWSTLVLILALIVSLTALVRTNELSGFVIGSLGDKADKADAKAQTALGDSANASTEAAHAKSTAEGVDSKATAAGKEADQAETSAANALTTASNARREAESFEARIASANDKAASASEKAADAESHLADALKQASDATAELNRLKSPRILTNASEFSSRLKEFAGTEYTFPSSFGDQESINLLKQIDSALQLAGWKRVKPDPAPIIVLNIYPDFGVALGTSTGVEVAVDSTVSAASLNADPQKWPALVKTAGLLKNSLAFCITPTEGNVRNELVVVPGSSTVVRITVGKKQ
jgi:hypothetical protein